MGVLMSLLTPHTCVSGMMVEVLGMVLGTAIQGQIVGGASSCPIELNNTNSSNSTTNPATVSLEETVKALPFPDTNEGSGFPASGKKTN